MTIDTPAHPHTALLLTASLGCAMTVLDTNVVGIVLPTIARDLNASFADIEWVISSYVLCFAALLLPAGSVADRYGRQRVFLAGMALFALASLACGWASTASLLSMARAAQGVGAAFLLAPALAIIGHAFHHPEQRARAWAIWGGIMGLTMVLSPLIGGLINSALGWRWAFYINLPLCGLLAVAVLRLVTESQDPQARALDLPGIALFSTAMLGLTWALILGPEQGWFAPPVLLRLMAGVVLFTLFLAVEKRRAQPMLDLTLFHNRPFVGAVAAMFAYAASAQVMASLLPLFLQNARGHSALGAGVAMLPFALAMLLMPQLGRWLGRWVASWQMLAVGLLVVGGGNLLMSLAAQSGGQGLLVLGMAVLGTGGGLLNGETQKAIMGTVARHRAGMASGISTTSRFTGILLGFAGLGAVLASGTRTAVREQMGTLRPHAASGFTDRVVAGDLERALALVPPAMADTATQLAQRAYGQGFAHAFVAAAMVALASAGLVVWAMRPGRAGVASQAPGRPRIVRTPSNAPTDAASGRAGSE